MAVSVSPYVHFNGNCEEAFNFYRSVLGGEFEYVGRMKDAQGMPVAPGEEEKILHISLPLGRGTWLLGSDVPQAFGKTNIGNNFYVSVNTDSKDEATKVFNGLAEGGKVQMPIASTFWGAYFGMCVDKFGVQWMVTFNERQ